MARYKIEDSTKKLTHIVSKPNKRVVKSCLKCLKLEAAEMAKKPLLIVCQYQRPACFKFGKKYKSLAVEGGRDDYLFWMNAQTIFFSAA